MNLDLIAKLHLLAAKNPQDAPVLLGAAAEIVRLRREDAGLRATCFRRCIASSPRCSPTRTIPMPARDSGD
jgi:hypothetical protein